MSPQAQSIAKNTTFLTVAYIFQKLFAFVYFTLVARFIGANDIGVYTFAISLTTIFSVFIDFGLSSVLTREAAKFKDRANEYLNNIISVKIVLAIISYLAVAVVINLLGKPAISQTMVYLAGLVMVLDSFTLAFFAVFRAYQNLKYEAIGIAINQIVILAVGLVGIYLKFPLYILVLALLAGSTFNFLYSLILLKVKLKFNLKLIWDKSILRTLFKIALPFALAGIFVRVYSYIDQILLSVLIGDQALGWYSVPYKITYAFQFVPAAFAAAIYPAMSDCFVNNKEKLRLIFDKAMYLLIILSVPATVGIACLADKIILSLYTAEFQPSILALQIFILAVIPIFLNYPVGSLLNACDRQARNTFNMGLTMVLNIILNLILIPKYQHVGAALAALTSLTALFILNLGQAPKIIKYDARYLAIKSAKSIFSSLIMAALILFLKARFNFVILIIIGAIVYLGIMYLIKGFTREDVQFLWQAIFKKAVPSEEETLRG
ncbi:MAG: flippase [Candidatus Parcubacteria bacterium]|nr:flippase [Candidatus Parcubacteria bacterium]